MGGLILATVRPVLEFASRHDASRAAAGLAAEALRGALNTGTRARLFASGGSTPVDMYDELSVYDLNWAEVDVALVDERCVPIDHVASNARLVREHLMGGVAGRATFHPMYLENGASDVAGTYEALMPADFIVLGMGLDGHTASWFPGAVNLQDTLASGDTVAEIDATGCDVAGEFTRRLTLTRQAVARSNQGVLLIFGEPKRRVLDASFAQPVMDAPIRAALEDLSNRLTIVWAP